LLCIFQGLKKTNHSTHILVNLFNPENASGAII